MNKILIIALLPAAFGVRAACLPDAPEPGDIGPDSASVCAALAHQFPGTALAVDGRSIHSGSWVTVTASVDGRPLQLDYRLTGLTWTLDNVGVSTPGATASRAASTR